MLFGWIIGDERKRTMKNNCRPRQRTLLLATTAVLALSMLLVACAPPATPVPPAGSEAPATGTTLAIGSKDFTEAILVAELYAQVLENAGFKVERKFNLGATPIAHAALVKGDIDLYPEYTSTGLQEVLKDTNRYGDAGAILGAVRKGYEEQFKLTWLQASPFNDTNAFATTLAVAEQYGLKTYSDLAAKAGELRLGGPAEFPDRVDTAGLDQAYGGFVGSFKEFKPLGTGTLRYDALKNGDVDVIVAFGTDGRIKGDNLVLLQDDKSFYPIYNIAPVVRLDVLDANPAIADALNRVAPLLTDDVMSGLNYEVDGPDKKEPGEVIRAFLQRSGVIE
jgi:osmoprotectant transport system substrate-binding protein